jgi:PhnB protein
MPVDKIPEGYEGITPYLICKNAASAIDFYKKAFGAEEMYRIGGPDMVSHAELRIGRAIFMMADEFPDMGAVGPQTLGGTPVSMYIYVDDVDSFAEKAIAEGAKVLKPVADQFYGDRSCYLEDPFGHKWSFATHIEDVSPEELSARAKAMFGEG